MFENHAIPADVVLQLADVLAVHGRVNPPGGKCFCGHEVPLGKRFTEHQVRALLDSPHMEAMLDQARAEALREAADDLQQWAGERHAESLADEHEPCDADCHDEGTCHIDARYAAVHGESARWLRERADRIGGAS